MSDRGAHDTFVIPVKTLAGSKTRLAGILSPEARAALTLSLLERTLSLLARHFPDHPIVLVTRDARVAALADPARCTVLDDSGTDTLNRAMDMAANWADNWTADMNGGRGPGGLCFLPADLARAEAGDIATLLALADGARGVAIAEASDGGTNGLVVRPCAALRFRFGPGSAAAHEAAARAAGLPVIRTRLDSLLHDVDQPDHLSLIPDGMPWARLTP